MGQLADWRCHKAVKAGKIIIHLPIRETASGKWLVTVEDVNGEAASVEMPADAFARGEPKLGDYVVLYEDGYKSWSPAKAFEDGYDRLPKE